MKNVRQLCAVVVLTLALAISTFADGTVHTGIVDPPPPPSTEGNMGTGSADTTGPSGDAADPVTALALGLVQNVLSLF